MAGLHALRGGGRSLMSQAVRGPASPLEAARAAIDRCVHCGFCLPTCPTYAALGDEADSPRGRLQLMKGLMDGEIDPSDPDLSLHLGRCLDCRACETACPSGVA